jgi:hypothetical protein
MMSYKKRPLCVSHHHFTKDDSHQQQQHHDARNVTLRSKLSDPTLNTETLVVGIAIHMLQPIDIPGSFFTVPKTDKSAVREYYDYLTAIINKQYNCMNDEFDSADFDSERLFSPILNSQKNSNINREVYGKLMSFSRRANISFECQYEYCDYVPDWDGFNDKSVSREEKLILKDSTNSKYRNVVDPIVKGCRFNPFTQTFEKDDSSPGVPTRAPGRFLDIWIVDFPDHEPGELGPMCGYSTFPDDIRAGTYADGFIGSINVFKRDRSSMYSGLNSYGTLAHESAHAFDLPHVFEQYGQLSDIPTEYEPDEGDVFGLKVWPQTDGEYHDILNYMGYTEDKNMVQNFTHDQVIKMRTTLRNHPKRKAWLVRIEKTSSRSDLIAPVEYKHAVPLPQNQSHSNVQKNNAKPSFLPFYQSADSSSSSAGNNNTTKNKDKVYVKKIDNDGNMIPKQTFGNEKQYRVAKSSSKNKSNGHNSISDFFSHILSKFYNLSICGTSYHH